MELPLRYTMYEVAVAVLSQLSVTVVLLSAVATRPVGAAGASVTGELSTLRFQSAPPLLSHARLLLLSGLAVKTTRRLVVPAGGV